MNTLTVNKKVRLLFVCLGNICRSPAAESIMAGMIQKNGLQDVIEVDSAGTSGWHAGELPDARMRSQGERRGYDFLSRSRKFRPADFDDFDYILTMDGQNFSDVKSIARNQGQINKIHLITEFSRQSPHHNHIPDPYYGGESGFELVLDLLEDACEGLLQKLNDI